MLGEVNSVVAAGGRPGGLSAGRGRWSGPGRRAGEPGQRGKGGPRFSFWVVPLHLKTYVPCVQRGPRPSRPRAPRLPPTRGPEGPVPAARTSGYRAAEAEATGAASESRAEGSERARGFPRRRR